jgi:hypothetical protein
MTVMEPRNGDVDTSCGGCISDSELINYINIWIGGSVVDADLIDAINDWINSVGCPES